MRFATAHDRYRFSASQQTLVCNLFHILENSTNYIKFTGIVTQSHRLLQEKVDVMYRCNPSVEGVLRG